MWKQKGKNLSDKKQDLPEREKGSTGSNEYQKISLIESHYEILLLLEQQVGRIIPNVIGFGNNKFGFTAHDAHITGLGLSGGKLTTLPENIGQLSTLQVLYLSGNNLTTIPITIGQLVALRELDLNDNHLAALPESISQLSSLQTLNLLNNRIITIPASIPQLIALQQLNLEKNQITTLPNNINQLKVLSVLNLSWNRLNVLNETIGEITTLTELNLRKNQLKSLPESLGNLTSLKQLDVRENNLISNPNVINSILTKLENQGCNVLIEKPARNFLKKDEIERLEKKTQQDEFDQLMQKDFSEDEAKELQDFHGTMLFKPEYFVMSLIEKLLGWPIPHVPLLGYSKFGFTTYLGHVIKLGLFGQKLKMLPKNIHYLTLLESLNLSGNHLTTLPESIGQLHSLKTLELFNNQLTTLPESVGLLTALQELNLVGNTLIDLPESIANLTSLKGLEMTEENYKSFSNKTTEILKQLQNQGCYVSLTIDKKVEKEVTGDKNTLWEDFFRDTPPPFGLIQEIDQAVNRWQTTLFSSNSPFLIPSQKKEGDPVILSEFTNSIIEAGGIKLISWVFKSQYDITSPGYQKIKKSACNLIEFWYCRGYLSPVHFTSRPPFDCKGKVGTPEYGYKALDQLYYGASPPLTILEDLLTNCYPLDLDTLMSYWNSIKFPGVVEMFWAQSLAFLSRIAMRLTRYLFGDKFMEGGPKDDIDTQVGYKATCIVIQWIISGIIPTLHYPPILSPGIPQDALIYHDRAYYIQKEYGNKFGMAYELEFKGNLYAYMNEPQKAEEQYQLAYALYKEINNRTFIGEILLRMGKVHDQINEPQKAHLQFELSTVEQELKRAEELAQPATINTNTPVAKLDKTVSKASSMGDVSSPRQSQSQSVPMDQITQSNSLFEHLRQGNPPPQDICKFMNEYLDFVQTTTNIKWATVANLGGGGVYPKDGSLLQRFIFYYQSLTEKLTKDVFEIEDVNEKDHTLIIQESLLMVERWWICGHLNPIPLLTLDEKYCQFLPFGGTIHPSFETLFANRFKILQTTPTSKPNLEPIINRVRQQLGSLNKPPQELFKMYLVGTPPPLEVLVLLDIFMITSFMQVDHSSMPFLKKYESVRQDGANLLISLIYGPNFIKEMNSSLRETLLQQAKLLLLVWYATGLFIPLCFKES